MKVDWDKSRDAGMVLSGVGLGLREFAGDNIGMRLLGESLVVVGIMATFVGVGERIIENLGRIARALEKVTPNKIEEERKPETDN